MIEAIKERKIKLTKGRIRGAEIKREIRKER